MGKFIITKRTNGEYQFNLEASNGRVILTSEGYTAKASCHKGIESVKTNAPTDTRYDRKAAKNDSFYFNLKAANGEIIGTSQMYSTAETRDNGIESVKENSPNASVEDETI
ncbi:YegP family protein [Pedobacter jeongneungensis]|uniref:YegP family protein n=1 Tax=Pedobacter jeongneungensis TaxID=947309 RepID=UPI00046857BC|nr:YegP family protein [Pedobacter jeongneungensis]